jgi:5-methylthioadenosine/S-adenosylhomocysteine deaminase
LNDSILIKNGIVVTMDHDRRIIENGAVAIREDRIEAVGKADEISGKIKADRIIDAKNKIIMPGLIDLHYHTALARGVSDGLPLGTYLETFWYPKLQNLKPDEAYWAAMLTYGEAIKSGTTTANDMYRHMIKCGEAAETLGIRAILSCDCADESEKLDTLKDNEEVVKAMHGRANNRIQVRIGVEWMPISSYEFLSEVRATANRNKVGIHIHLNESLGELEASKKKFGKRPVEVAYDLGILGPDCVAAHCVWLTPTEIRLLRETSTPVSHDPGSNAKLGNGICPVPELLASGVTVGLGHDDSECNNTVDLFEAMKLASVIHRAHRVDASLMQPQTVLEMATINGAKALQMEKEIGSIEPRKKADVILVDTHKLRLTPVISGKQLNVLSHLVYATHGDDVDTVIVDGKIIMENRIIKMFSEDMIIEKATQACKDVLARIS